MGPRSCQERRDAPYSNDQTKCNRNGEERFNQGMSQRIVDLDRLFGRAGGLRWQGQNEATEDCLGCAPVRPRRHAQCRSEGIEDIWCIGRPDDSVGQHSALARDAGCDSSLITGNLDLDLIRLAVGEWCEHLVGYSGASYQVLLCLTPFDNLGPDDIATIVIEDQEVAGVLAGTPQTDAERGRMSRSGNNH